jgi:hypothetical protein
VEHEHGTPKLNVWCALTYDFLIGPLISEEATIRGATYLNMLKNYAIVQLPQGFISQQDRAPPHYANQVKAFLIQQFQGKLNGRGVISHDLSGHQI